MSNRLSLGFCHGWPDLACPKSTIPYLSSPMFWLAATGDCMFTSHLAWSRPIECLLGCSPYQGDTVLCLGGLSWLWFKGLQSNAIMTALWKLASIPIEGKSSECLICMNYRIIIVIIIISLGHICYRILQTHHACTHARMHTRTRARMHTRTGAHGRANTRAHTQPSPPSPFTAQAIAIHRRPTVTASSTGIHRGAPFVAGSRVREINNTRTPPEFPDNLEVFRI